jgi:hypothetical protein
MSESKMSDELKRTLGLITVTEEQVSTNKDVTPFTQKPLEVTPFVPKNVSTSVPESNTDLRQDYIASRNITHTLIDYAGSALQGALVVAVESQHPKAFEVFNQLATTMRGLSKDLLEMQKTYQNILEMTEAKNKPTAPQTITQNNITITPNEPEVKNTTNTSMAEVVRMMKNMADSAKQKSTPIVSDLDEVIDVE